MRIYVAGRFQSYHKVRWVIDELFRQGHEITYDWTRTKEFNDYGESFDNQRGLSRATLASYALKDLRGIDSADVIVVCGDDSLAGAWVEVGYALALDRVILVVKPERWTIFLELPNVRQFSCYADLFQHLATMENNA